MSEKKTEALSDEALKEVAGGKVSAIYGCQFCGKEFASAAQREAHEQNCSQR